MAKQAKNTICLWYDGDAEEAAGFHATTFTPLALTNAVFGADRAAAKRAFDAMMQMKKIDIAAIEAARRG